MPGRGRRGSSCALPGSQIPAPASGLGCQHFVNCHNSEAPALPGQKFCTPHLCSLGPVTSSTLATCCLPATQAPEPEFAAGQAQALLPTLKGLAASAAPEPATCPWESGSGLGITAPPLQHPSSGGVGSLPPFQLCPSAEAGACLHPQHLRNPRKKCPPTQPGLVPQAPHPQENSTWPHQWLQIPSAISPPAGEGRRCEAVGAVVKLAFPVCLPAPPLPRGPQPLHEGIRQGCCHLGKVNHSPPSPLPEPQAVGSLRWP